MRKLISLVLTLSLFISLLTVPAFAQTTKTKDYKLETQQDVIQLLNDVNKGDPNAIEKLNSFKAFNKDEVGKALKGIKLTSAERSKSIKFNDGSEIVLELVLEEQPNVSDSRELQASAITSSCYYKAKILGVEFARYTLTLHYSGDSNGNCWGLYCTQGSSALYPYTVTKNGAYPIVNQGLYVKGTGSADFNYAGHASYTVILTMWGYSNPTNNWWTTDID